MNALVKKEIRVLLPMFLLGSALTLSNWFFPPGHFDNLDSFLVVAPFFILCPGIAVLLVLSSFGAEMASGTFSMLLVQPVSRREIWRVKVSLLSLALLLYGIFYFFTLIHMNQVHFSRLGRPDVPGENYVWAVLIGLFAISIFSGGLWTVLLLRQAAAAFWFTFLLPGLLLIITEGILFNVGDPWFLIWSTVIFGSYSLAGFWFARRLFLRAQDVQWAGGVIEMPQMRMGARGSLGKETQRRWRPRGALWWKEVQLHQAQFVMAGALVVMHLIVLAVRKFGNFGQSPNLKFVLETFWMLWLILPLIVGCAAIAEERKLGTLEGQLCLPVKRRSQFRIKLCVVMILCVLFGVVMPVLFEGARILPAGRLDIEPSNSYVTYSFLSGNFYVVAYQFLIATGLAPLRILLAFAGLLGLAALTGTVSYHVSSLARNTLQALAPAVVLAGILGVLLLMSSEMPQSLWRYLWGGSIGDFIIFPVLILTLTTLASSNFRRMTAGWKLWLRDAVVLIFALLLSSLATAATYHRFWEKRSPLEPAHGRALLSQENPPALKMNGNECIVRMSDGGEWMGIFLFSPSMTGLNTVLGNLRLKIENGHFLASSNWVEIKRVDRNQIGLKTDGTLWISQNAMNQSWPPRDHQTNQIKESFSQVGTETDWISFQPDAWGGVFLVKRDGTLWRLGSTNMSLKSSEQWPDLRRLTPYRLGTDSDWISIFHDQFEFVFRKNDGTLWVWGSQSLSTSRIQLNLGNGSILYKFGSYDEAQFRSTALMWNGQFYRVGIASNKTFRIYANQSPSAWRSTDFQIGTESNWVAVAGRFSEAVTLKNDGSLWLWDFSLNGYESSFEDAESTMAAVKPKRLGTHSDWVAVAEANHQVSGTQAVIALAADGGLWYWPLKRDYYSSFVGNAGEPLLSFSRKPQLLANIFGPVASSATP